MGGRRRRRRRRRELRWKKRSKKEIERKGVTKGVEGAMMMTVSFSFFCFIVGVVYRAGRDE